VWLHALTAKAWRNSARDDPAVGALERLSPAAVRADRGRAAQVECGWCFDDLVVFDARSWPAGTTTSSRFMLGGSPRCRTSVGDPLLASGYR
jgi:hypothetical protein